MVREKRMNERWGRERLKEREGGSMKDRDGERMKEWERINLRTEFQYVYMNFEFHKFYSLPNHIFIRVISRGGKYKTDVVW